MTAKELRELLRSVPDDTEVEISSIYDRETEKWMPSKTIEGHHDRKKGKFFLTPEIVSIE